MADFVAGSKPDGTLSTDTQDADALRRDADARRRDLAASVAALRETVSDTLDVEKQAQRLMAAGKERAEIALVQARNGIRQRPGLFLGVAIGIVSLFAAGYAVYVRSQPPPWARKLKAYRRALSERVYIRVGRPDTVVYR